MTESLARIHGEIPPVGGPESWLRVEPSSHSLSESVREEQILSKRLELVEIEWKSPSPLLWPNQRLIRKSKQPS